MEEVISFFTKFWAIMLIAAIIGGVFLFFVSPHYNQPTQILSQYQQATGTSILIVPCGNEASSTVYAQIVSEYTPKYTITD